MQLEQAGGIPRVPKSSFFPVSQLIGIAVWTELNFWIQQEAGDRLQERKLESETILAFFELL